MREALGGSGEAQFNRVMGAFEMMARTPIGGSDTAFNQLVTKELSEPSSVLRSVLSPRQTVIDAIDNNWVQRNADRIASALTNPESIDQLKQLSKIPDAKERSLRIVTFILGLQGGGAIDDALQTQPEQLPIGSIQ